MSDTRMRRWQPLAIAAAVVAIGALTGVGAAALAGEPPAVQRPDGVVRAFPTLPPLPSPAPSPLGRAITRTDWLNARLALPALPACPARTVTFRKGIAQTASRDVVWTVGGFGDRGSRVLGEPADGKPVYGDIDADGDLDALVVVECFAPRIEGKFVLAYRSGAAGPQLMGLVAQTLPEGEWPQEAHVQEGIISVLIRAQDPVSGRELGVVGTTTMRWSGGAFVRADPTAGIEDLDRGKLVFRVPRLGGCPARTGTLPADSEEGGGRSAHWSVKDYGDAEFRPRPGDLTGDGTAELLVAVGCMPAINALTNATDQEVAVFVLSRDARGALVVLGRLPIARALYADSLVIRDRVARVGLALPNGSHVSATYRWTGSTFLRVS